MSWNGGGNSSLPYSKTAPIRFKERGVVNLPTDPRLKGGLGSKTEYPTPIIQLSTAHKMAQPFNPQLFVL